MMKSQFFVHKHTGHIVALLFIFGSSFSWPDPVAQPNSYPDPPALTAENVTSVDVYLGKAFLGMSKATCANDHSEMRLYANSVVELAIQASKQQSIHDLSSIYTRIMLAQLVLATTYDGTAQPIERDLALAAAGRSYTRWRVGESKSDEELLAYLRQ